MNKENLQTKFEHLDFLFLKTRISHLPLILHLNVHWYTAAALFQDYN